MEEKQPRKDPGLEERRKLVEILTKNARKNLANLAPGIYSFDHLEGHFGFRVSEGLFDTLGTIGVWKAAGKKGERLTEFVEERPISKEELNIASRPELIKLTPIEQQVIDFIIKNNPKKPGEIPKIFCRKTEDRSALLAGLYERYDVTNFQELVRKLMHTRKKTVE